MANKKYADCPQWLQDYLFYMLTIRGRSPRTVDAYYIDIRTFLRYIKLTKLGLPSGEFPQLSIDDVTMDTIRGITLSDVYGFLNFTLTERSNSAAARSRKISCIRSLFHYLTVKTGALEENPVKNLELPRQKRALPKYLTLEESLSLITHIQTPFPERDYCMITLFLNCGMRLAELVGINISDIRGNTLKLLGKGNKERIVFLNDACLEAISQYLQVRTPTAKADSRDALFLGRNGERISHRRVQQILKECLKMAGLDGKGYSPHKLRHTAATLMYQHGHVDIRVLKEILGHENLATTEIYTHVSDKQIEHAAQKNPLAKVKLDKKKKS